MLAGPFDEVGGRPAPWAYEPSATSPATAFGVAHLSDREAGRAVATGYAMNVPGAPTRVDNAAPPFGGSHRLFTARPAASPASDAVFAGPSSPTANGMYVYRDVWKTLFR
jgi:hypothetical protein